MKKKIISSLLAVAMMFSIAIPAVSAANSDVQGSYAAVTKITTDAPEYAIKTNGSIDMSEHIAVFENNTKLVTDLSHIRYELNGPTGEYNGFYLQGNSVFARQPNREATLTIYDNYNKSTTNARVTVKLRSTDVAYGGTAESFTFKDSYKVLPITQNAENTAEDQTFRVRSHPAGAVFTDTDKGKIDAAVIAAINNTLMNTTSGNSASLPTTVTTNYTAGSPATFRVDMTGASIKTAAAADAVLTVGGVILTSSSALTVSTAYTATQLTSLLAGGAVTGTSVDGKTYKVTADSATSLLFTATTVGLGTSSMAGIAATLVNTAGTDVVAPSARTTAVAGTDAVATSTSQIDLAGATLTPGTNFSVMDVNYIAGTGETAATIVTKLISLLNASTNATTAKYTWSTTTLSTTTNLIATTDTAADGALATISNNIATLAGSNGNLLNIQPSVYKENQTELEFTITKENLGVIPTAMVYDINKNVVVKMARLDNRLPEFSSSLNFTAQKAVSAVSFSIPQNNIDIKVGETIKIPVTYYPPNANVAKKTLFDVKSFLNNGKPFQYAVISGDALVGDEVKIIGVNSNDTAKAVLTGQIQKLGVQTAFVNINVKPTDFNTEIPYTSKISASSVEVEVGASAPIAITGVPAGVTVKWVYKDDGSIILKSDTTASTAVVGKKVGVNKLTATLSNGEKFTCDVTVKAATVVKPDPDKKPSEVPQTGDTLFSNLF